MFTISRDGILYAHCALADSELHGRKAMLLTYQADGKPLEPFILKLNLKLGSNCAVAVVCDDAETLILCDTAGVANNSVTVNRSPRF
jgi:hypothetical protein